MPKPLITQHRLHELFHYDPEVGVFVCRIKRRGPANVGRIAGSPDQDGYTRIGVDYCAYLAHRLAWVYVYGDHPHGDIDHINGRRTDNRISNLRLATVSQNNQNIKKANTQSSHGWLGATFDKRKQKWRTRIRVNGRKLSFGLHDTAELAHLKYLEVKRQLHPFCTI